MHTSARVETVTGCLAAAPTIIMRPGEPTAGALTLLVWHDGVHGHTTLPPAITRVLCHVSGSAAERVVRTCQRGDAVTITGPVIAVPTGAGPAAPPTIQITTLALVARAARMAEGWSARPCPSPTPRLHAGAR